MTSTSGQPDSSRAWGSGRLLWPMAAWFWALQFAVLNPIMAALLVSVYGATVAQTGLALGAYNLGGFIASIVIPTIADRRRDYLGPLLVAAVCGLAMIVVLVLTASLPFAVLALVLLGGPPGVGSTLLFAQLRHAGASPARVMRTRAIVSFAWVVGPPLATVLIGLWGNRAALVLLAIVAAINVASSLLLIRQRRGAETEDAPRPSLLTQLRGGRKWGIVIAFVGLQTTNVATVTTAALFVVHHLHAPVVWAGIALGAAALLEIPALLLISRITTRPMTLLLIGCVTGVVYYGLAALVDHAWELVLLQPLNAWFFATVAGLGLTLFQDIFPSPGLASGLFTNTRRAGAVLSGLLITSVAAAPDEYRVLYVLSTAVVFVVLVCLGIGAVRHSGRLTVPAD